MMTMDELKAIKLSLETGRRDSLTPALMGLMVGMMGAHLAGWFDYWCVVWAVASVSFFTWRGLHDRHIHRRAKTIVLRERAAGTAGLENIERQVLQ